MPNGNNQYFSSCFVVLIEYAIRKLINQAAPRSSAKHLIGLRVVGYPVYGLCYFLAEANTKAHPLAFIVPPGLVQLEFGNLEKRYSHSALYFANTSRKETVLSSPRR